MTKPAPALVAPRSLPRPRWRGHRPSKSSSPRIERPRALMCSPLVRSKRNAAGARRRKLKNAVCAASPA